MPCPSVTSWDPYLAPHPSSTCSQLSSKLLLAQELFPADPSHDSFNHNFYRHSLSQMASASALFTGPQGHYHTRLTLLSSYHPM